ncbi:GDP-mannose 4,6-dehydratase, partial [Patescibacteria group bacterium]|nr:GDP-mannose 4,6-dehydratase [Patescibacteria group bacterium]
DTNIIGVFNILEAVKNSKGVKNYVQVSTDEVYGSLDLDSQEKFEEDTAFAPNVPYAATKAGGDLLCRAYFRTFEVPVVVTHCSNNYGPYQYPEKLIPFFILRMIENKKLPLYGDGKNVRDWIYVLDHCSALESCLFKGKPGEVYNIGADNEMQNIEIAKLILNYFDRDESWLEYVSDRPGHDSRYSVDSSKIRRELGWRLKYEFKETFKQTIDWYLENKNWVENVREKTGVFNPHIDLWEKHQPKG